MVLGRGKDGVVEGIITGPQIIDGSHSMHKSMHLADPQRRGNPRKSSKGPKLRLEVPGT
jgi:hypothetical protein